MDKPAADFAAMKGHLEILKWIRDNGGEWTSDAADSAAANGDLETLKWIRDNGGEWTHCAAAWAALGSHIETLKWIGDNGGDLTIGIARYVYENFKWTHPHLAAAMERRS